MPETSVDIPTPVVLRALEAVQESLIRRGRRRRKTGGPKTAVMQPKELCARLKTEFSRRGDDLQNLVLACQPKSSPVTWEEAAAELRRMAPAKCRSVLASRLRQGVVGLAGLWNAVDLEPFHHLLNEDEVRGRTARAYFALLVAQDAASLGGYGWILKYDDVQAVANLRCVHERLLETVYQLYREDRRTLTRCLAHGSTPVATWSLILLYNANRADGQPASARTEFGPVEPPHGRRLEAGVDRGTGDGPRARRPIPRGLLRKFGRRESGAARGHGDLPVLSQGLALAPGCLLRLNGNDPLGLIQDARPP